jgi:uncharacterized membrane protein
MTTEAQDAERTGSESSAAAGLSAPHRLFGLADGIFAISMTLLALEVRIPDYVLDTRDGYGHAALDFYRDFGVFIIAFLITASFWQINHSVMADLERVDAGVRKRIVPFLAGISSIPVATAVLFRFGSVPQAITFAALLLAATTLASARLWWYLSDPKRGLSRNPPEARLPRLVSQLFSAAVFLLAIPVAYLLASVSDDHIAYAMLIWLLLRFDRPVAHLVLRQLGRAPVGAAGDLP